MSLPQKNGIHVTHAAGLGPGTTHVDGNARDAVSGDVCNAINAGHASQTFGPTATRTAETTTTIKIGTTGVTEARATVRGVRLRMNSRIEGPTPKIVVVAAVLRMDGGLMECVDSLSQRW